MSEKIVPLPIPASNPPSNPNRRLDPHKFTIDTILPRLKKKGNPFAGLLDKKIATTNTKILTKL
jgi:DNA primase